MNRQTCIKTQIVTSIILNITILRLIKNFHDKKNDFRFCTSYDWTSSWEKKVFQNPYFHKPHFSSISVLIVFVTREMYIPQSYYTFSLDVDQIIQFDWTEV